MDRLLVLLWLGSLSFLIAVALLIGCVIHYRQLRRAIGKVEQIPGASTDFILDAIEATRVQLSTTGDDLRGQETTIKNRINWLIGRVDELIKTVKELLSKP